MKIGHVMQSLMCWAPASRGNAGAVSHGSRARAPQLGSTHAHFRMPVFLKRILKSGDGGARSAALQAQVRQPSSQQSPVVFTGARLGGFDLFDFDYMEHEDKVGRNAEAQTRGTGSAGPTMLSRRLNNGSEVFCFEPGAVLSSRHKTSFTANVSKAFDGTSNKAFTSVEQYMMFSKGQVINQHLNNRSPEYKQNQRIMADILKENDPAVIRRLGRNLQGYDAAAGAWEAQRKDYAKMAWHDALAQNPSMKAILINTRNMPLIETSKSPVWGVGVGADRLSSVGDQSRWFDVNDRTQNLTGKVLMELRAEFASA